MKCNYILDNFQQNRKTILAYEAIYADVSYTILCKYENISELHKKDIITNLQKGKLWIFFISKQGNYKSNQRKLSLIREWAYRCLFKIYHKCSYLMSSASDWFTQNNAMSPIGTNPSKLRTCWLSLQGSIATTVANLHKGKIIPN